LRSRLLRRGVAPAVGVAAAVLAGEAGAANTPVPLIHATLQAAVAFAAGEAAGAALSPEAVTLAKGALRGMFLSQLKLMAVWLLAACVFAGGAVWTLQALEARPAAQEKGEPIPERAAQPPKDLHVVQVTKPLPGGLERSIQRPSRVSAIDEAELIPRASGVLKNLMVNIGDSVKKGQIVAEIVAPELVLEERQAGAAVRQVEGAILEGDARVAIAKSEVQAAQKAVLAKVAEMDSAKALHNISKKELERLQKARAQAGLAVSATDLAIAEAQERAAISKTIVARAAVEGARADVEIKLGQVKLAEAAMLALTAKLEGAKLTQEKARLALDQTRLVAPLDGVVTHCNARAGDFVRSGASGSPTSLLTIQRVDRLRVVVFVPEFYALLTGPGTPVELSFDAVPGVRVKGKVARTAFVVDESKGEMRVEVALPNPAGQFRPGMSGKATLHQLKVPNAVRIPESALIALPPAGDRPFLKKGGGGFGGGGPRAVAVYVVRDGKAVRTPVERGIQGEGGEVEIIFGIGPNDLVVTDPSGLSGETVAVEVKEKKAPPE
jgi:RND family efflux transporter MFP subunit